MLFSNCKLFLCCRCVSVIINYVFVTVALVLFKISKKTKQFQTHSRHSAAVAVQGVHSAVVPALEVRAPHLGIVSH